MIFKWIEENLNANSLTSGIRNTGKALRGLANNPLEEINGGFSEMVGWFIDIPDIPDFSNVNRNTLINKRGNDLHVPVLYGERIIGGNIVFVATGGDDNEYLYLAVVLCEGPVHEINEIYINDVLSTDSKYSAFVTTNKLKKGGTENNTANTLLDDHPDWSSSHLLQGLAYVGIRLKFEPSQFSGIPDIKVRVKGRKVYDPRKDITSAGYDSTKGVTTHRDDDPSTWEYSDNNVLCLRDYMTNSDYGKGLSTADIDDVAVKESANFLDSQVTEYTGGGTVNTYTCNMLVDTKNNIFNNVSLMLKSFRGLIPYSEGKYKIRVDDDPASVTYQFTADNILSDISVQSASRKDRYNRVIARFANKELNYESDEVSYPELLDSDHTTFLAEDNGIAQEFTIDLPATTSVYQARDIAQTALLISRNQMLTVSLTGDSDSIVCEVGDKVTVDYSDLGFSAKEFKVRQMTINNDFTCSFTLVEHDGNIFDWYEAGQVTVATPPATDLPTDSSPSQPSAGNLFISDETDADGSNNKVLKYTIPASGFAFLDYYEVSYEVGEGGTFGNTENIQTRGNEVKLYGWTAGKQYRFRHRIVSTYGRRSLNSNSVTLSTNISDSVTVDGTRLIDDTAEFSKTKAFTDKSYGGTPSAPFYKGYVGPTLSGGGFENSRFAVGGKGYDNATYETGGLIGYSEAAVGLQAITENKTTHGYYDSNLDHYGAGTFIGGYQYSELDGTSDVRLAYMNMGAELILGPKEAAQTISQTYATNPVRVRTQVGQGWESGDSIYITGVSGMTQLNGNGYFIKKIGTNNFDLYTDGLLTTAVDGTSWSAGTGGTAENLTRPEVIPNSAFTPSAHIRLCWLNGVGYSIYTMQGTTGPFTASHDGLVAKNIDQPEIGDIMVDIDMFAAPNINDCITTMKLSSQANQVGVIGVCAGYNNQSFVPASLGDASKPKSDEPSHSPVLSLASEYASVPQTYNFIAVNCIGEGKINVCGQAGNISVGDLIVASDTQGKGMKQSDDIIRSYTVAKSRENVTFASADEVKQIACIYLGG